MATSTAQPPSVRRRTISHHLKPLQRLAPHSSHAPASNPVTIIVPNRRTPTARNTGPTAVGTISGKSRDPAFTTTVPPSSAVTTTLLPCPTLNTCIRKTPPAELAAYAPPVTTNDATTQFATTARETPIRRRKTHNTSGTYNTTITHAAGARNAIAAPGISLRCSTIQTIQCAKNVETAANAAPAPLHTNSSPNCTNDNIMTTATIGKAIKPVKSPYNVTCWKWNNTNGTDATVPIRFAATAPHINLRTDNLNRAHRVSARSARNSARAILRANNPDCTRVTISSSAAVQAKVNWNPASRKSAGRTITMQITAAASIFMYVGGRSINREISTITTTIAARTTGGPHGVAATYPSTIPPHTTSRHRGRIGTNRNTTHTTHAKNSLTCDPDIASRCATPASAKARDTSSIDTSRWPNSSATIVFAASESTFTVCCSNFPRRNRRPSPSRYPATSSGALFNDNPPTRGTRTRKNPIRSQPLPQIHSSWIHCSHRPTQPPIRLNPVPAPQLSAAVALTRHFTCAKPHAFTSTPPSKSPSPPS